MKKNIKGFSLVEIIMVLVVISILIAISVPTYIHYIVRVQITEAFLLADTAKNYVTEFYINNNDFPSSNELAYFSGAKGKYVNDISIRDDGVITVTFSAYDPQSANIKLNNNTIIFTPSAPAESYNLIWTCSSSLKKNYLPEECK